MDGRTVVVDAMRADPDRPRYALELLRDTRLHSGTLYPTLVRLERSGLVTSRREDSGRLVYLLTPDGVTSLDRDVPSQPRVTAGVRRSGGARVAAATARRGGALLPAGSVRRAVAMWLPAAAVGAVEAYAALSRPAGGRLTDLGVYLGATRGLRGGASLYDFVSGHAPFTYPPFAGLLFAPLTYLATLPVQVAWTLGTLLAVVVLSVLVTRAAGGPFRGAAPVVAAVLVASAPVSSDIKYGQVSIALATLVVVDALALRRTRAHGLLTGLAAAVKLTPLIFIPMLWLAGRRRAAALAAGTFAACGVLGWAVLPGDSWRFWATEMWDVHRLGFITSVGNQSLDGALMRAGIAEPGRSVPVVAVVAVVAVLALRRAAYLARAGDLLSALTVVGAASIVVSPVSWTHHQVWLVFAALLPVAGSARARVAWIAVVLGVTVLPVTALGPPVWSNARLILAVAVACVFPLRTGTSDPRGHPAEVRASAMRMSSTP